MPNQFVQADGTLHFEVFNPWVTLRAGEASLFDADGSTLIIHVNADDCRSDPSGNAGARPACAVIQKR
jgi:Cu-Zn family superoxide dismutase